MTKVNAIDIAAARVRDRGAETNEAVRRRRGRTVTRFRGDPGIGKAFDALVTGDDALRRARELMALWNNVHIVELEGPGFSTPAGTPILVSPQRNTSEIRGGATHAAFSGECHEIGPGAGLRGSMFVTVRTLPNVWSEAGLTRVLLPANSRNPSDPITSGTEQVVDDPDAHPFTDNWGTQDDAFQGDEVAKGQVKYDLRPGHFGNQVTLASPATQVRNYEGATSGSGTGTSRALFAFHRRGRLELDPASQEGGEGTVKWRFGSGGNAPELEARIAGFDAWGVERWSPWLAEIRLPDGVRVHVHAHGLVRVLGLGDKLRFPAVYDDQDQGNHAFVEELTQGGGTTETSWWITATEDWQLTGDAVAGDTDLSILNGGDVYLFRESGTTAEAETLARTLMKDVKQRIQLEVV